MELIKKIKQAEARAQDIIDKAAADAAKHAEEARKKRQAQMAAAQQDRRKKVESAVAAAASQGKKEADALKEEAEATRRQLRSRTKGTIPAAVEKVVAYLKG